MSRYTNPIRCREQYERRRAKLLAARALGTHTKKQWDILVFQCGFKCVKCGLEGYHLDKDHIVPLFMGGSDAIGNLQPLCAWCNGKKDRECIDYRPALVTARKLIAIVGWPR